VGELQDEGAYGADLGEDHHAGDDEGEMIFVGELELGDLHSQTKEQASTQAVKLCRKPGKISYAAALGGVAA
jgi:hypothetical protein